MKRCEIVGKSIIRPDTIDKASGRTRYMDDLRFPGMAYACLVQSECAHGEIVNIDVSGALKYPGVKAVITASDIPGVNLIPLMKEDWIFLADKKVVYVGQPVAVIVADTRRAAYAARKLVKVQYEKLPPVFDPEEALKEGAPVINETLGNLLVYHKIRRGDIESGLNEADYVVEGVYETGYQEHAYLETQSILAVPGGEDRMDVFGSMQCPFYVQNAVSAILGLPHSKVRVELAPTGGAFGGKEDFPSIFGGLAALAAWKTDGPVNLVLSRNEDISMSSKRHPCRAYYRTGIDRKGHVIACEARVILDAGAFATLSPAVLWRCAVHCCGPYNIPNVKVDAYAAATNKIPCGAFRGFGTPKVIFAMERQMDILASKIGMDPMDMREINILKTGDRTITGQELPWSVGMEETIEKAREASEWNTKYSASPIEKNRKKRGIGCATFLYGVGLGAAGSKIDQAEAYVQVKPDGSAIFAVGTTEMGEGMQGALTQITAEALGGRPVDKIQMLPVDTSRVADSGPTVASRATYTSGNAILDACEKIMSNMKKCASLILECNEDEVVLENGLFRSKNPVSLTVSFEKTAGECKLRHIPTSFQGFFQTPETSWDPETGQGKAYVTYSYATQIAEIEVDMETCEVNVLNIWAAHDVGHAINPREVKGQIEGGVVQGMGYALSEFIRHDEKGKIMNPAFSTYIIPTILDIPDIQAIIVESGYPEGPYLAKGFAETPLMGMAACIANAVSNALGINVTSIPILPEGLIKAVRKQENKK